MKDSKYQYVRSLSGCYHLLGNKRHWQGSTRLEVWRVNKHTLDGIQWHNTKLEFYCMYDEFKAKVYAKIQQARQDHK